MEFFKKIKTVTGEERTAEFFCKNNTILSVRGLDFQKGDTFDTLTMPDKFEASGQSEYKIKFISPNVLKPYTDDDCENYNENVFIYHKINKIIISNGIKQIDRNAFIGTIVDEIEFGSCCEYIGDSAFLHSTIKTVSFHPAQSKKVKLEIGDYAFNNCDNLSSVSLPSHCSRIGRGAFNGCVSLKNIKLPPEIEFIGARAFCLCENFTEITWPENCPTIPASCFSNCKNLSNLIIPNSHICILDTFTSTKIKELDLKNLLYVEFDKENDLRNSEIKVIPPYYGGIELIDMLTNIGRQSGLL